MKAVKEHRILVFGDLQNVAQSYSDITRTWSALPQIPVTITIAFSPTACVLGTGAFFMWVVLSQCLGVDLELVLAAMRTVPNLTHFPPGLLPLMTSFLYGQSIVVAGGYDSKGIVLASAVCYSLHSRSWRTDVPSMTTPRCGSATVEMDGRMLVFGGMNATVFVKSCEAFDPTTNQWTPLPPMSTPREEACAVTWEGRAFVFGGFDGLTALSSAECFDPTTNQWSAIAPMTTVRRSAAAVVVPGRGVLMMGGITHNVLHSAELYDPVANRWTTMTWELPTPLYDFAAHYIDGVLHIVGGCTLYGHCIRDCWSMDLNSTVPVWSSLPPMPLAVHPMTSVTV